MFFKKRGNNREEPLHTEIILLKTTLEMIHSELRDIKREIRETNHLMLKYIQLQAVQESNEANDKPPAASPKPPREEPEPHLPTATAPAVKHDTTDTGINLHSEQTKRMIKVVKDILTSGNGLSVTKKPNIKNYHIGRRPPDIDFIIDGTKIALMQRGTDFYIPQRQLLTITRTKVRLPKHFLEEIYKEHLIVKNVIRAEDRSSKNLYFRVAPIAFEVVKEYPENHYAPARSDSLECVKLSPELSNYIRRLVNK